MKILFGMQRSLLSQGKRHKSEADLDKNASDRIGSFSGDSDSDGDIVMFHPLNNGMVDADIIEGSDSPEEWLPQRPQSWMLQPVLANFENPADEGQCVSPQALKQAIDKGHIFQARNLLKDARSSVTPDSLASAVKVVSTFQPESMDLFQDLLNHSQVDLNQPKNDPLALRLLDTAIAARKFNAFQMILKHPGLSESTLNFADEAGENLYYKLHKNQRHSWVELLREHPEFTINHAVAPQETALVLAAKAGNLPAVKVYMAERTLKLRVANQEAEALLAAQSEGHTAVYDYLRHGLYMFSLHDIQAFNALKDEAEAALKDREDLKSTRKLLLYLNRLAPERREAVKESMLRLVKGGYPDEDLFQQLCRRTKVSVFRPIER